MNFSQVKIFNPSGSDKKQDRQMILGNSTNLINLNENKFTWAESLYNQMRANFWVPEKLSLTEDIVCYTKLSKHEKNTFDGILSYLTFLDSVQSTNLPHLKSPITAPEVQVCIAEQISQETMHNKSYQFIIQTVVAEENRNNIYERWREDKVLMARCEYISDKYQVYLDNPTLDNYVLALCANYLLEGLYFFNGFIFFYGLSTRHLMPGTADIIRIINRDEFTHVVLYQKILPEVLKFSNVKEGGWLFDEIVTLFDTSTQYEIDWTNNITSDGDGVSKIIGITAETTENYSKYLTNSLMRNIGFPELYQGVSNPYRNLENLGDVGKDAHIRANFFEAGVTSYIMSDGIGGWGEI